MQHQYQKKERTQNLFQQGCNPIPVYSRFFYSVNLQPVCSARLTEPIQNWKIYTDRVDPAHGAGTLHTSTESEKSMQTRRSFHQSGVRLRRVLLWYQALFLLQTVNRGA